MLAHTVPGFYLHTLGHAVLECQWFALIWVRVICLMSDVVHKHLNQSVGHMLFDSDKKPTFGR